MGQRVPTDKESNSDAALFHWSYYRQRPLPRELAAHASHEALFADPTFGTAAW